MPFKAIDLTGKRFGKLVVIERCYDLPKKEGTVYWRCKCDCGNEKIVTSNRLRSGDTSSCGCARRNNLVGKRFGRLLVIEKAGKMNGNQTYFCKCDCGNIVRCYHSNLTKGASTSCGCFQKETALKRFTTHGMRKSRLYCIYANMKSRCTNPHNKRYSSYGGRGICVCDDWLHSFENFYCWAMQSGYSESLTIDRINVNENYCPENCRWVTISEQSNNQRKTIKITILGKEQSLKQWTTYMGWNKRYGTFSNRHRKGKPPFNEDELTQIEQKLRKEQDNVLQD